MLNATMQQVNADYAHGLITGAEWLRLTREVMGLQEAAETESSREVEETCGECGCIVSWSDGCVEDERLETADCEVFCGEACAIRAGYRECESCYEWSLADEGFYAEDGKWFCSADCAHNECYERCERCGEWTDDYIIAENGESAYCCEDCAREAGLFICDRCGEWRDPSVRGEYGPYTVNSHGDTEEWCTWCTDNNSFVCDSCAERYDDDHYGHDGYCENCDGGEHLHEYGYRPPIRFFGGSRYQRDTPFMGIELETDSGDDRRTYTDELNALCCGGSFEEMFWMTEDSSLRNGVEVTSHPMTLACHESIRSLYEGIAETARRFGYVSHDSGNCGLHVHVNREFFGRTKEAQEAGGYKMLRALQRFEQGFTVFSRRTDNYWCSYRTSENFTPKKEKGHIEYTMKDMLRKAERAAASYEHSQCLNFQHSSTFEFRIFRGTLKLETYYASLALVNGLCHTAKNRGSMFFERCTWYELIDEIVSRCEDGFAKECLVDYLDEKGLR